MFTHIHTHIDRQAGRQTDSKGNMVYLNLHCQLNFKDTVIKPVDIHNKSNNNHNNNDNNNDNDNNNNK